MNLYMLLSHPRTETYYRFSIVAAESEAEAKTYHPGGQLRYINNNWYRPNHSSLPCRDDTWTTPEWVNATLLGVADPSIKPGVVISAN